MPAPGSLKPKLAQGDSSDVPEESLQAIRRRLLLTPVFFYTRARRRMGVRTRATAALLVVLFAVISGVALNIAKPAQTEAYTVSNTVNFQARLETAAGAIVPDGNYNVQFKLYNVSTGGTALWTESYLNSASQGITVANGYLTANLNSINNSWGAVNWNQQLYLTMNIGGTTTGAPTYDGEMSPRLKMTALPYAFQAGQLADTGGVGSTLGWNTQTTARSILLPDEAGTLCIQNSANCGFATGTAGSYIQNTTSLQTSSNFHISGSGTADTSLITPSVTSTGALTLQAGGTNQAITLDSSGTGAVNIGTGATNKTINIGTTGTTANQIINLGANTAATSVSTITIGTATNTNSTVTIQAGTTAGNGAIQIGTLANSVTQTIRIGTNTTAAQTITIGSSGGGTVTLAGTVNASSGLQVGGTSRITSAGQLQNVSFGSATSALVTDSSGNIAAALGATSGQCLLSNGTATAPSFQTCPGSGGVTGIGTIDSQTKSANGAVIASSNLVLQSADANFPGLVTTGTQTFAGAKTFNGTVTINDIVNATTVSSATSGTVVANTLKVTANPSSSSTASYYGSQSVSQYTGTAGTTGAVVGAYNLGTINSSSSVQSVYGTYSLGQTVNSAAITNLLGAAAIASASSVASGAVTNGVALQVTVANNSTAGATITNGYGLKVISPTASATGTIGTVYGIYVQGQAGTGITNAYGIYQAGSSDLNVFNGATTFGSTLAVSGNTTLNGQQNVIQPASSLTSGQTNVAQTFTNASSTGGTIQGYSQNITVSNTVSASNTNGINITLADNGTGGNVDKGLNVSLTGSNSSRAQIGVSSTVDRGLAIQGISSGIPGNSSGQCNSVSSLGVGICGGDTGGSTSGAGIYGYSNSRDSGTIDSAVGAGVYGINQNSGASASTFLSGVKGIALQSSNAASTSIGVFGQATAGGALATAYGGYFTLGSTSATTLGSALYASNGSIAANILQLQDNTTNVFTVANEGAVTLQNTTNSAAAFQVLTTAATSSLPVVTADTSSLKLQVGSATTDANAVQLVLDSYNNATDPTGVNGSMYYNTNLGAFRCYQNGTWTNCVGGGNAILNQTSLQASSNFHVQSAATGSVTGQIQVLAGQTADLLDFENSSGAVLSGFTAAGALQGGNGSGTNAGGQNLVLNGGQGTGTGTGGNINFQIAKPGSSGSTLNSEAIVFKLNGATGAATFQNAADSTTAFQIQDTNAHNYIQIDTSGANLYLGNTGIASTIQVGNTTGAVAQTINIGTNTTASSNNTLNIGSQIGSSPVTVKSGTGGITLSPVGTSGSGVMVKPANDSTTAFQIQNAALSGATTLFAADTANLRVNVTGDTNAGTRFGNRLFSDNFESGTMAFWDQGVNTIATQSSIVHDGKYAAQANSTSSAYASATITGGTTTYLRAWVYVGSQTSSLAGLLNLQDISGQSFVVSRLSTTGNLEFWDGVTNVHTDSGVSMSTLGWHLIEMRVTTGNPTGASQVWLDGAQIVNLSSQNNGTNVLGTAKIGDSTGGRTFNTYFDDVTADTVSTGTASSLNVDDSFHVGGTAAFNSGVLIQPASNSAAALQIQNSAGTDLLVADTAKGQVTISGGVAGTGSGANGGTGAGAAGDMGGGGGGGIGTANGTANACTGGTGGQGVDVSGLFAVVSGLGYATTGPGAGPGCGSTSPNAMNGGAATGFGSGGGGAGYYGGMGGNGLYGGGGGGASGYTATNRVGGTGGQGVVVMSPSGGGSNVVQTSGTSYTVPAGVTSIKIWAIGAGGGGAGATNIDGTSGGAGGAGGVVYNTFAVSPGQTITFSLGTGGAGGTNTANGSGGGTTTVTVGSVTLTATGGAGGQYNNGLTAAGGTYSNSGGTTVFNVQDNNGTSLLKVDATQLQVTVGGNLDAQSFSVNGTPGASVSCAAGSLLQNATVVNGLITGGSCTGASYAIAYNSAAQSIANVAVTVVGLNSERQDTDNYHNNVTNNSRLVAPSAGYYHITANWAWDPVTTGNRYADILLNNATVIAADRRVAAGYAGEGSLSIDYYLNAGDYVQFRVYQDTGAALNLSAASNSPVFSIFKVSANPGGSGALTVGTLDSQVKSSDGAVISGGSIYLQSADASNPGLISTGSQVLAGAKTFTSTLTASGGLSVSSSLNVNTTGLSVNSSTGTFDLEGSGGATLTVGRSTSTSGATTTISIKGARNASNIYGQLDFYNYDSIGTGADFVGARVAGRQDGTNNAALEFYTAKTNTLSTNPVLKLDSNGAATFRNSTNGTGGFLIQNSTGGTLLSFDTSATNGHLTVGGANVAGHTDKVELVRTGTTTENALRFTNTTGTDWRILQPTGTDNLVFTGDAFSTNVLTLSATDGSALFKNDADSTTAFQIQSSTASSSTPLFTVDTQNKNLQIGSATTDGTAVLTILDSYNNAADPTGTTGAMYYNTSLNAFRCYQNGAWTNCITPLPVSAVAGSDTANSSSTTPSNVSGLSFSLAANTKYYYKFVVLTQSAATTTGVGFGVTTPTTPTSVNWCANTMATTSAATAGGAGSYCGTGDVSTTTGAVQAANTTYESVMEGYIQTGANSGTLQLRIRTEVNASAVTAKAGSWGVLTPVQ